MSKWVYGVIGFLGLIWLATTSLAPLVVGLLAVALIYQWGKSKSPQGA